MSDRHLFIFSTLHWYFRPAGPGVPRAFCTPALQGMPSPNMLTSSVCSCPLQSSLITYCPPHEFTYSDPTCKGTCEDSFPYDYPCFILGIDISFRTWNSHPCWYVHKCPLHLSVLSMRARLLSVAHVSSSSLQDGFERSAETAGIVGCVCVDSTGQFLPMVRRSGRMYRRQGVAYLSNLAVDHNFRRKGVARQLLAQAAEVGRWELTSTA